MKTVLRGVLAVLTGFALCLAFLWIMGRFLGVSGEVPQ